MMITKERVIGLLLENKDKINEFGVKEIGVFGSFVNEKQNEKSDIDILVDFKKDRKTFDNYIDLKSFLEKIFGRDVDLIIKSALKKRIKSYIMNEVEYARF